jgi:hypothetical protein
MGDSGTGINNLNFYLGQLNITTTSELATLHNPGDCAMPFDGDATVDITTVSAATMRNLFTFGTDSIDINDIATEDLLYRVNWTDNSNNPLDIDIDLLANVISGNIASGLSNQNMTYDYVRYIALKLFNTANGVDLFNNESTLRSSLKNKFNITLNNMLIELASLGSQTANDTTNNPVLSAMNQMIHHAPNRFANIQNDLYYSQGVDLNGNEISVYKIPFIAGDKVYFSAIVDAAENQHTIVNRQITIPRRTYLIKLTLQ